jgi:hypothetical protein
MRKRLGEPSGVEPLPAKRMRPILNLVDGVHLSSERDVAIRREFNGKV